MRKSRFSEEQIIKILKEKEAGAKLANWRIPTGGVAELCSTTCGRSAHPKRQTQVQGPL